MRAIRVTVIAAVSLLLATSVLMPLIVGILTVPAAAGRLSLMALGVVSLLVLALVIRRATKAVEAELDRLRAETRGVVEIVGLDPVVQPVGHVTSATPRPGLLLADPDGVRLTNFDRTEIVLDARWTDVADITVNHTFEPILEMELHRDGAATHWWFGVWSPVRERLPPWIRRWGRRSRTQRLVVTLQALSGRRDEVTPA
jgi:hypothetical protein